MSQPEPGKYGRLRGALGFIWFTMTALSAAASHRDQPAPPGVLAALQDLLDDNDDCRDC